jgi:hypothetical protein
VLEEVPVLEMFRWRRIIMDECHELAEHALPEAGGGDRQDAPWVLPLMTLSTRAVSGTS